MSCVKRLFIAFTYLLAALMIANGTAQAISAPTLAVPPGLSLAELKITGNEFIMLQNNTGTTISDLGQYWIYGYNNVNPLAAGVNSSTQQLPIGSLADGQTILLSQTGGATCGAAITGKLSISLTDSGGYLQVVKTSLVNNVLIQTAGDAVSWSSGANSASGMIANVSSNSADPNGAFYRYQNLVPTPPYLWQKASISSSNSCQLNVVVSGTVASGPLNPGSQLLPSVPPPATIISVASAVGTGGLPSSDIGLMAPMITELLPNPASPQSDSEDEFTEIYNPNSASFDLSGFKLQTVSSSSSNKRTYTFPNGTKIAAKSYAAYPSANISISLTNSGGQVWLLDPEDNVISQTEPYTSAKDGQAWALANGQWYWTSTPTPNAANVVKAAGGNDSAQQGGVGTVQGASTMAGNSTGNGNSNNVNQPAAPIHTAVLVGVGILALVYGLYEYRQDMGNWVYRLKRYRIARRKAG